MRKRCTKLILLVALLLGIGAVNGNAMPDKTGEDLPVRVVKISLVEGTRDQFFDQLKKFADTHAFAIRIAPTRPDLQGFLIQMWREDFQGIGTNGVKIKQFRIGFYKMRNEPIPDFVLNLIFAGLKKAVAKVPGATFTEIRMKYHDR